MPRSSKKIEPGQFDPVDIEGRPPLEQEWEPSQLIGERVADLKLTDEDPAPNALGDEEGALEDDGPGSEALAARFELLPIEWVTGEPAVETLRFELTDGLRYVGELADEEPDETDDAEGEDPDEHDLLDEAAADPDEGDSNLESGDDTESSDDLGTVDSDDAAIDEQALVESSDDSGDDSLPANAVSESAHLEALEAARAEAFQQGLAQGTEEGLRQGLAQGHEQGLSQGLEQARQSYEADFSARQAQLDELITAVQTATSDSHRLFAPLKRLALHLAEQLVRGELSLSGEAINRLVEHALVEVDRAPGNELVLSLNPEDLERWKRVAPPSFDTIECRADPGLSIGSVRVSSGESIIEDLIEHRLHQMAARLLGEAPARGFSRMTSLRMHAGVHEDISDVG
jgi:flagellar biosynthesis/type III secretory pathway protein FliH